MTRHEARDAGIARYVPDTGPCERGHTSERYTRNGSCVECEAVRQRLRNTELQQYRRTQRAARGP